MSSRPKLAHEETYTDRVVPHKGSATDPIQDTLGSHSFDLTRLADDIRKIERQLAISMERAIAESQQDLRRQITEELRRQFDLELQSGIAIVKEQLEMRFRAAADEWEADKRRLTTEIEELRKLADADAILLEIATTESRLETIIRELSNLIDSSDNTLADLMRKNAEQSRVKAYLEGLQFRLAHSESPEAGSS